MIYKTGREFLDAPFQAITFLGMSGVGKTHTSATLQDWGWEHASCDYWIGMRHLKDPLVEFQKYHAPGQKLSVDDLSILSDFIGKLGLERKGGYKLDFFLERQKLYYDAEEQSLLDALSELKKRSEIKDTQDLQDKRRYVLDTTGSFCEIQNEKLIDALGQKSLFVYIQAGEEERQEILKRAEEYPKPLFYNPALLLQWLDEYRDEFGVEPGDNDPDHLARWVFPKLFFSRIPKYESMAHRYGVIIPSSDFQSIETEGQFLDLIAKAIDGAGH